MLQSFLFLFFYFNVFDGNFMKSSIELASTFHFVNYAWKNISSSVNMKIVFATTDDKPLPICKVEGV